MIEINISKFCCHFLYGSLHWARVKDRSARLKQRRLLAECN